MTKIKVCIAGVTGWAGSALAKGVISSNELDLVSGVSRSSAGNNLAHDLGIGAGEIPIYDSVDQALQSSDFDVLVEYTKPDVAKQNILSAIQKGVNVVVGTSGLSNEDYAEIESAANESGTSVLAVGNFALTVVLLQKFSEMAAKYIPNYEIIDYAYEGKVDAPSGTVRELAHRLSNIQPAKIHVPQHDIVGEKDTRGARMGEVQVHAVRLPGHVIAVETIFGLKDEKLTLRHDAGSSAEPYVQGGLLAIAKVGTFKGLKRGLDSVMDF